MKKNKTINITLAIFIGLVLGALFGLLMPGHYEFLLPFVELVSSLYMNALRMMIYPLVFCSLIVGIQGIGSVGATGKIGGQALLYFSATTLFASTLGLFLPQMLGLGKGVDIQMVESNVEAAKFTSLVDTVKNLIPSNPVASFATGDMLQVLVFAVIAGIACLALGKKAEPFVVLCESLNEICIKVVSWVMYCTPVGIFCSIATVMYANGIDTMIALGQVLIAQYATYFLYILIVYGGIVACFAALSAIAGLPAGVMGVYISVNTLCDMGATCCNVLGDIACSVAMKETVKLDAANTTDNKNKQKAVQHE